MINNIYSVMKQLEDEPSKNAKEEILKRSEGNTDFREALTFLLNPYIVTGISTKKMSKRFKKSEMDLAEEEQSIKDFKSLIDYLKSNNTGRDADIKRVLYFISRQESTDLGVFVTKFVTKTLKLGISEKTVNKVYGADTIPTFAVMLAESYAKKKDKLKGEFYITLKLDGNRCVAIVSDTGVKFFSRKGQPIEGLTDLENQFKTLPNAVYDGELLLDNKDNLKSDELFRATQKVIRKDGVKKDLNFYIFDTLTIEEFTKGKSNKTYAQRRKTLDVVIQSFAEETTNIAVLPVLYVGEDQDMIPAYATVMEEKGYEGVMVNTSNGLYQTKRVVDLLKVKSFLSADGIVTGLYEGTGKYEGMLGGVLISYKDVMVKVGSGFTDVERKKYWEDKDSLIGKIGQYNYFEESKNQNGGYDLRFATWKGLRDDKTVDDLNYE